MTRTEILRLLSTELQREKRNSFPDHICAQTNRITAAAGKLSSISDAIKYKGDKQVLMVMARKAAVKVIVNCWRFLENN